MGSPSLGDLFVVAGMIAYAIHSVIAIRELRAFPAAYPRLVDDGDLAAYARLARRQMWRAVVILIAVSLLLIISFLSDLGTLGTASWALFTVVVIASVPSLRGAQRAARGVPVVGPALLARKNEIDILWDDKLVPPKDLIATVGTLDGSEPTPPGSATARVAAQCSFFFLLVALFANSKPIPFLWMMAPWAIAIQRLGLWVGPVVLIAALLAHRRSAAAMALLLLGYTAERVACASIAFQLVTGAELALLTIWSLFVIGLYAVGTVGLLRAR